MAAAMAVEAPLTTGATAVEASLTTGAIAVEACEIRAAAPLVRSPTIPPRFWAETTPAAAERTMTEARILKVWLEKVI